MVIAHGWSDSAQGTVGPEAVVKFDPPADARSGLGAGLVGVQIHIFILERAPEPLNKWGMILSFGHECSPCVEV